MKKQQISLKPLKKEDVVIDKLLTSLIIIADYFVKTNSKSRIINYKVNEGEFYLYVEFANIFSDLGIFIRVFYENYLKIENKDIDRISIIIKNKENNRIIILSPEDISDYMTNKITVEQLTSKIKWT